MNQQNKEQGTSDAVLTKSQIEDFRTSGLKFADYLVEEYYSRDTKPIVKKEDKIEYTSAPTNGKTMDVIIEEYKAQFESLSSQSQSVYNLKPYQTYATMQSAVGDMLGFMVGTAMFSWIASPLSTELEICVTDELAKKLKLPEHFLFEKNGLGIINFCLADGMLAPVFAAKHQYLARNPDLKIHPPFVVYLNKSPDYAFIQRNLELADFIVKEVPDSDSVISTLKEDEAQGRQPLFISFNYPAMHISQDVYEYCSAHHIWLHCDTQDMGPLSLLQEYEGQVKDYEHYSSLSMEGGYWLGTGLETSLMWVVDREKIKEALQFPFLMKNNLYIKTENQKTGYDINYKDYQVHLGRRMRSGKMWTVFNMLGAEGLRDIFRTRIKLMKTLETQIKAHPDRFIDVQLSKPHELRFKLVKMSVPDYIKRLEEKGIQIGVEGDELVIWVNLFKMDEALLVHIAESLIGLAV